MRLARAVLVVVGVIALVPASGFAESQAGWGSGIALMATEVVNASLSDEAISDEEEIEVDLKSIAGSVGASTGATGLSEGFEEECVGLEEAADVMTANDGLLVGFSLEGGASSSFNRIKQELIDKGWVPASGGQSNCATFVKQSGAYRWLFVTCSDVSGRTCVVVQCEKGSG